MANDLNLCVFTGNLGRDPDIKYTAGGMAIANFSIAVGGRKKVGEQWEDSTEWVPVVCFAKTAENVGKYLTKGSKVRITGEFRTSSWEKDGERRYKSEIVVANGGGLQMLSPRNDNSGQTRSPQSQPNPQPNPQPQSTGAGGFEDFDGDIPFNQLSAKVYF